VCTMIIFSIFLLELLHFYIILIILRTIKHINYFKKNKYIMKLGITLYDNGVQLLSKCSTPISIFYFHILAHSTPPLIRRVHACGRR